MLEDFIFEGTIPSNNPWSWPSQPFGSRAWDLSMFTFP